MSGSLNQYLQSTNSPLINDVNIVDYIDRRISDLTRPGGLNYYNTNQRGYTAIVSMEGQGGAFSDIQNAINYATYINKSGAIFIKNGTYTISETINISSVNGGLQIIGESRDNTVLKVGSAINLTSSQPVINVYDDRTLLTNLTINGNSGQQNNGTQIMIYLNGAEDVLIDNISIIEQYGTAGAAISGTLVAGNIITNCIFNTQGYAVFGTNMSNSIIKDCTANACGYGFFVGQNCNITDTVVDTTTLGAGFRSESPETNFLNCKAVSCFNYGFQLTQQRCVVLGCKIEQNGSAGVYSSALYNVISKNIFDQEDNYAIHLDGAILNNIEGNNIVMGDPTSKHGIFLNNSLDNVIANNTIDLFTTGTYSDGVYSAIFLQGTSTRNNISGNRIYADSGTMNFAYGYRENGTVDNSNLITGNIITGAGTQIGTQGADSVAASNITA